ncbi:MULTISPECIES: 4-hydroxyphenylacetate 3-hydroxylase N-terminal domain-containing protein [unclassified Caballeronia]|uniref:4-hydroxyphenylacetate 3-hydroxylase family protein n=1 Tax=unclassified Caballeronia TaxID=2646786 RepID=UPI002858ACC3|nr:MULTISPECIES: 4-hydroxyphenylacetate 3-hydroxylase N-terminal domain-containing protein [unclassified Caballeronia]MDR5752627.1 4-hydroxyphenylacetate 3-hydroxylase N-terminal domain-containing protein [Caballeronia sp. LZ024]MDR5841614.1 4-hydroxyphenylacetate 3-hydroxylase N-terminal domain-containing protein [Caballeronia sp. LZ031]
MKIEPMVEAFAGQGHDNAMYTGSEFLASLNDGREIWLNGERVENVVEHPAFRNSARMIARFYDALHDPKRRDVLTTEMDDGSGMRCHRFFQAPRSADEQLRARDAIAETARINYGWMGRTPDFKAAWIGTFGANRELYGEYGANAQRWYDIARRRLPFINHAVVNPPVDRHLDPNHSDVFVHVEAETHAGLVVSGAKVVATGAALTHFTFVAHYNVMYSDKKYSPVFIVPTNAPGVKLICRQSYELNATLTGTPFDHPLSSRMDENDSILVFDKVLIPWEDVFMYGVEMSNRFVEHSGFFGRTLMHGCTRLAVKFDFICGLFLKAVSMAGTRGFQGVQGAVGEAIALRHMLWSLSDSMAWRADPWKDDFVLPNIESALAYRSIAGDSYSRVINLIRKTVASSLIYLPSHAADFAQAEERSYLDRYVRGSDGVDSVERVKLMKLLWDAIGSEFASRHELYEINYSGSYEKSRIDTFNIAHATGRSSEMHAFVEQCMSEYDLNGWLAPDLRAVGAQSASH